MTQDYQPQRVRGGQVQVINPGLLAFKNQPGAANPSFLPTFNRLVVLNPWISGKAKKACRCVRRKRGRFYPEGSQLKVLGFLNVTHSEVPSEDARANDLPKGAKAEKEKSLPWYVEIPIIVVLTMLLVFILQTFVGRVYVIPSQSMEPTLHGCEGCVGDRIVVDKLSYRFSDPKPGDVIVFKGTESWDTTFISQRSANPGLRAVQNLGSYVGLVAPDENDLVKRIIATGGQTVSCQEGDPGIMVDGKKVDDSFTLHPLYYPVNPATGSDECGGPYFGPITVPADHYFMMGDNRTNSLDSRFHTGDAEQGTIPRENIRGKVQFIIYPFSRIGGVEDYQIQH